MWRARRVGDVISYQFIKRWALDGPGFSAPATSDASAAVGARGSGLPLFAGVIQPDELRAGGSTTRWRSRCPGPAQRDLRAPGVGDQRHQRHRLAARGRAPAAEVELPARQLPGGANRRSAEAIVTALRTLRRDRRRPLDHADALRAAQHDYGTLLLGNELRSVRLSDLEVVRTGPLLRFPPLESTPEAVQG